MEWIGN